MRVTFKKTMAIILAMLMVLGGFNGVLVGGKQAYAADPVQFEGGSGLFIDDPYLIASADQLNKMREKPYNTYYKLIADIDLSSYASGEGWRPIINFSASLDGNGYKITNLTINRPASEYNGDGLFATINSDGVVSNIRLENISVIGGHYTGGLVGFNYGEIHNSSTSGSVSGKNYVGGLIGNNNGLISNSFSAGSVNTTINVAGGLVGYNRGNINSSYATGSVNGLGAGGLVGLQGGSGSSPTINNSYAAGIVTGQYIRGGLVASNTSGTINNSYYDIGTTMQSDTGKGKGITTENMKDKSTFSGWNFNSEWYMIPGQYPLLWGYTALTAGTNGGTTKLNHVSPGMVYTVDNGSDISVTGAVYNINIDNIPASLGTEISVRLAEDSTSSIKLKVNNTSLKPAPAPTAMLAVGTDVIGSTQLTNVTDTMEYKVNSAPYTAITGTSVDNIAVTKGDQISIRFKEITQPASFVQILSVDASNIKTVSASISTIKGVTAPVEFEYPVYSITSTDEYTGEVVWSPANDGFEAGVAYTATITLTPKSGYTFTELPANFFKVEGAATTNLAGDGVVTAVFPVTSETFGVGSGTVEDPYQIATAAQLSKIGYYNNKDDKHFKLVANIDLRTYSDGLWTPIYEFNGTLDGNGYKIKNLLVNSTDWDQGLFGSIYSDGVLTNIILDNVDISGQGELGGLAGYNDGTISNSYVIGKVSGNNEESSYVGGLVGYNDGTINNSYATVSTSGDNAIGGLVGYNYGTITSSYATGKVSGNSNTGGLVGFNNDGTDERSFTTLSVNDSSDTGSLVRSNDYGTITSSFYNKETTEQSDTEKGVGLSTADMRLQSNYPEVDWDFTATWGIHSSKNNGIPYLRALQLYVTYDGNGNNGGSVPDGSISYSKGEAVSISGNTGNLTKQGYTFSGWNTLANGQGTSFATADTFLITGDKKLYAKWTLNYSGGDGPSPTVPPTTPTPTPTPKPFYNDKVNIDVINALVEKAKDAPAVTFKDVPASAPNAKAIELAGKLGIIKGNANGSFHGNATITRAEFATMLVRALGLTAENDTNFKDTKGHWAADAIATLKASGIINGYVDGMFKPNQTITRAEIVAMLSKVMNTTLVKNDKFKDVSGNWAEAEIDTLSDMGIVKGTADGSFKPNANATRSESLVMILRMLNASLGHSLDVE